MTTKTLNIIQGQDMTGRLATATTYTASGGTIIAGLTLNEWGVIIGAFVAVTSMLYNFWHKAQIRKLARDGIQAGAPVHLDEG